MNKEKYIAEEKERLKDRDRRKCKETEIERNVKRQRQKEMLVL